jgi:tRNA 2-thiocytidine biosynthesis protein TtcA
MTEATPIEPATSLAAPAEYPAAGPGLLRLVEKAIDTFELVRPGDRVAVGISGGKDSLLLAATLRDLARRPGADFVVEGVHLDQKQPGFDRETFDRSIARLGIPVHIVGEDTWSVVASKLQPGQIPCALCGRMRRGILNRWCDEAGFTRLALGHHLDDAIETFFLNLFFQRRLDPLKPLTPSDTHSSVATIRPLILIEERNIRDWVKRHQVETVACPVCDSFPESSRRNVGDLIDQLRSFHPELAASVRAALYGG